MNVNTNTKTKTSDRATGPGVTVRVEAQAPAAVEPSPRVCEVAAMFGLGVDEQKTLDILPPTDLTLRGGQLVFVTGASGGGKTTLLRRITEVLRADNPAQNASSMSAPRVATDGGDPVRVRLIDFNALRRAGDAPLVDQLGPDESLEQVTRWLALAGLNDAAVMLRRPGELSDGQRYRFRLAQAMAAAETGDADGPNDREHAPGLTVVLADEFAATLDRLTAHVIARNVRQWTRRRGDVCFIAATTHDDLLEPIEPDTLIVQHPGEGMEVLQRNDQ